MQQQKSGLAGFQLSNLAGTGFGRISKIKIRPEPEPDSSPIKFRCSLAVTGCKKPYVIVNPINVAAYFFMNFITFTFSDKLIIKDSLLLSVTSNLQQLTFQKILNSILQSPFFKIQKVKISSNNKLLKWHMPTVIVKH